jgi:hypothetical protein
MLASPGSLALWSRPLECGAIVSVLALFFAPPAVAAEDSRAREARTACLSGDYAKGVSILSELFVSTRVSTYIYNQGRCFEQNARYREAIARFQEYLRVAKDAPADERAEAEKHIADCRVQLAQESPSPTTASLTPAAPPVASSPPEVSAAPAVDSLSGSVASTSEPGSGLRTAGILVAAAGGAALVTAVALNVKANGMAGAYGTYNGYTDRKEEQRQSYETWGWVGYGAGAACVATGALLYYFGSRGNSSPAVALLPSADGAALVVRGSL